jgi:hypothetical protein
VYDITDPHSLDNLDHWRKEFLDQVGGGIHGLGDASTQFPFVVLGNKMDKVRNEVQMNHNNNIIIIKKLFLTDVQLFHFDCLPLFPYRPKIGWFHGSRRKIGVGWPQAPRSWGRNRCHISKRPQRPQSLSTMPFRRRPGERWFMRITRNGPSRNCLFRRRPTASQSIYVIRPAV